MTLTMSLEDHVTDRACRGAGPAITAPRPVLIGDEAASDRTAREALLDKAFGPARFDKPSERLRESRLPAAGLALAARDGRALVGTLRLWHVLAGEERPSLLLGPLAVAEEYRSRGIGRRLVAESLFRALTLGHRSVLLVGDAAYYGRFGFERRFTRDLSMPAPVDPERFLGLELVEGALDGASGLVVATGAIAMGRVRGRSSRRFRPAA